MDERLIPASISTDMQNTDEGVTITISYYDDQGVIIIPQKVNIGLLAVINREANTLIERDNAAVHKRDAATIAGELAITMQDILRGFLPLKEGT